MMRLEYDAVAVAGQCGCPAVVLAELSFLGPGLLANPSSSSHHLALITGCLSGGHMTDAVMVEW